MTTGRLRELLDQHWRISSSGDYARSDALMREILDEFPSEPEVLMRWGFARADAAPEEAKAFLLRAARLAPEDAYLQVSIGGALHSLGAIDESVACAKRATRCVPEDFTFGPQLANLVGRLAASKDKPELARELLQWAFEQEPEFRGFAHDLAEFLVRHDGTQAALDVLRELPPDLPSDDLAHELRARLEREEQ